MCVHIYIYVYAPIHSSKEGRRPARGSRPPEHCGGPHPRGGRSASPSPEAPLPLLSSLLSSLLASLTDGGVNI